LTRVCANEAALNTLRVKSHGSFGNANLCLKPGQKLMQINSPITIAANPGLLERRKSVPRNFVTCPEAISHRIKTRYRVSAG
jgi:hypothetical protein